MEELHEQQNLQETVEEYQQVSFRRIEELEQYGIAKADIQKLKAGGYHTIESVRSVSLFCSYRYSVIKYIFIFFRLRIQLRENWLKSKELVNKKLKN
jgi:hypothetical protein